MGTFRDKALNRLQEWRKEVPESVWDTTPVNLEAVGKYWGVQKVIKRRLDVSGLLYRLDEGGSVIFLKEDDPPSRQRFSLAHELGHIVMSESQLPEVSCRQSGQINRELEQCCDQIAAMLLMPEQQFRLLANKLGWNLRAVGELARHFHVSKEAAAIHLHGLTKDAVLMSTWSVRTNALSDLKLTRRSPNEAAWKFKPKIYWKNGPSDMAPIYEALTTPRVSMGESRVLVDVSGESLYKSVPTEGLRIGAGKFAAKVVGFHYLEKH